MDSSEFNSSESSIQCPNHAGGNETDQSQIAPRVFQRIDTRLTSAENTRLVFGRVPEWTKGADCKSAHANLADAETLQNKQFAKPADEQARRLSVLLSADPRLSAILTAWADLPEPVRAGIAAMVTAATPKS